MSRARARAQAAWPVPPSWYPAVLPSEPLGGPLHPVRHTNRSRCWCGPAALSVVTGLDTETTTRAIREATGRPAVTGVHRWEMIRTIHHLGYRCPGRFHRMPGPRKEHPTLAAWLRKRTARELHHTFIVIITGHYVVVRGRKAVDNVTKEPVWIRQMRKRRARVRAVLPVGR